MGTLIGVLCALAGAAAYGAAGVLQHHSAHQAPQRGAMRPRLLFDLIQIRAFRAGVIFAAGGFVLQVVALRFAPLALVQPLLVTGTLFYIGFAYAMRRQWPDARLMLGALVAMVGLTGFLLLASPSEAPSEVAEPMGDVAVVPLGMVLVGLVAACLVAATVVHSDLRAMPLAIATAICYGVTAGLVRELSSSANLTEPGYILSQWQLYGVVIIGVAGFLLNQNAFQSGLIGALASAVITVGDPIVAVAFGATWLGENIASGPLVTALQAVMMALVAGGVLLLARRSQQVAQEFREETVSAAGVS
ncbi:DMT family transporter [Actinopolymorpha rutila]|uniref:Drug/metabolite transporter (DMT)-like permease n=1 Tax=Actinopolymorpha rutila TaxID=446787 RepID=A0A852ZGF7_9ACTN|nr:DMT family transporter [Actinopolymorpha rutila]NYH91383.1 drug/metabolite transporter (DMT)-like permease [Actinopolymorpha rutila]